MIDHAKRAAYLAAALMATVNAALLVGMIF
jgi:hypothetical protein